MGSPCKLGHAVTDSATHQLIPEDYEKLCYFDERILMCPANMIVDILQPQPASLCELFVRGSPLALTPANRAHPKHRCVDLNDCLTTIMDNSLARQSYSIVQRN